MFRLHLSLLSPNMKCTVILVLVLATFSYGEAVSLCNLSGKKEASNQN